jgi:putative membrane protein
MSERDRTLLANERTFLAWWRTGLAALTAGLAAAQLVPKLAGSAHQWPYTVLGVGLAALGTLCLGYGHWRRIMVERAVSRGEDAGPNGGVTTLLALLGVLAGIGLIVLILLTD